MKFFNAVDRLAIMLPRERKHRLSRECYRGQIAVAFTTCLRLEPATIVDAVAFELIHSKLIHAAAKFDCELTAWCLMPDHLHVLLFGRSPEADTWKAIVDFKQQTGYWLKTNRPGIVWQRDFYDHVIRSDESLERHARYILENPMRAGLVVDWTDHPRTGGELVAAFRAEETERG